MAQQTTTTDGGTDPMTDDRLEAVGTIRIEWETFRDTLWRNYLDENLAMNSNSYVLRLSPPFEAEMEADKHVSQKGNFYPPEMSPKPIHIRPERIIQEGLDRGFNAPGLVEWPTRSNTSDALTEDELEDYEGGLDAAVEEAREVFWGELKHSRPTEIDLGRLVQSHGGSHVVAIEWIDEDGVE